jgi:hypothetical protein
MLYVAKDTIKPNGIASAVHLAGLAGKTGDVGPAYHLGDSARVSADSEVIQLRVYKHI